MEYKVKFDDHTKGPSLFESDSLDLVQTWLEQHTAWGVYDSSPGKLYERRRAKQTWATNPKGDCVPDKFGRNVTVVVPALGRLMDTDSFRGAQSRSMEGEDLCRRVRAV